MITGEWILLLWFAGHGNYAYGVTVVPGFADEQLCQKAGQEFMLKAQRRLEPSYLCVMRTPNRREE